jgi:hypothetical protein
MFLWISVLLLLICCACCSGETINGEGSATRHDTSMSSLRDIIAARKAKHNAEDPFINWLRSLQEPSQDTFRAISLACVNFHLGFSDICRGLYYPNATTPFMRAINLHTDQDGTHYRFILHDLAILGLDDSFTASDLLGIMYSRDNTASRDLVAELTVLGRQSLSPAVRYFMMESMEEHGNVLFTTYFDVVKRLKDIDPDQLYFFGEKHLELESGHLMNQEDGVNERDLFDTVALTPLEYEAAVNVSHATWNAFEKWQAGMFRTIQNLPAIIAADKLHRIM